MIETRWVVAAPPILLIASLAGGNWVTSIPAEVWLPGIGALSVGWAGLIRVLYLGIGITALNLCIAIVIDWSIRNAGSSLGRWLNSRVLTQLGLMSYSLYLWQQPFLNGHERRPWTILPSSLVLLVVAASLSYYAVELPIQRLRPRLERRFRAAP